MLGKFSEWTKFSMHFCPKCFSDPDFKKRLRSLRPSATPCEFHPEQSGISGTRIFDILDRVIRSSFAPMGANAPDQALSLADIVSDLIEPTVPSLAGTIAEKIAAARQVDAERADFYRHGATYLPFEEADFRHEYLWSEFRETVMFQQRFLNSRARSNLHEIFEGIDRQRDELRRSPAYLLNPGELAASFFRARIARGKIPLSDYDEQIKYLSPPPKSFRKAGRLNAAGIPAFYGAFDVRTCIAELRAPVGSIVLVGRFQLTRPICVLDSMFFALPPKRLNRFFDSHARRVAQYRFLKRFMYEISQPVLPSDEHLNYVPSQVVAEFLTTELKCKVEGGSMGIDALIFRSAQNPDGRNIAILGEAAHVEGQDDSQNWWFPSERRPAIRLVPNSVKAFEVLSAVPEYSEFRPFLI